MSTQDTDTKASNQKEVKEYQTFRFVDYRVYQDSKKWFEEVLTLRGLFDTTPSLWNQLKNNVTSVVMNIAAASTKLPQEARRYLGFSITAANKSVACLDIARDLETITSDEFQTFSEGFKGVIIQLKKFIKALGAGKAESKPAEA